MKQAKGFIGSLLDLSFTSLITSKIIKLLYILSIVGAGLAALSMIATSFAASTMTGLFTLLILAPLVFFLSVIYARVLLEIVIVIFRISENTAEIAEQGRHHPSGSTGDTPEL
ncbi:MAG: DUF4282 domain-containing protein [Bacteroidetes bacterium]|jgi:uncharacterized membrane protein|nr:DUF4282 domain-containing protein [Bacteroidota bacterium]